MANGRVEEESQQRSRCTPTMENGTTIIHSDSGHWATTAPTKTGQYVADRNAPEMAQDEELKKDCWSEFCDRMWLCLNYPKTKRKSSQVHPVIREEMCATEGGLVMMGKRNGSVIVCDIASTGDAEEGEGEKVQECQMNEVEGVNDGEEDEERAKRNVWELERGSEEVQDYNEVVCDEEDIVKEDVKSEKDNLIEDEEPKKEADCDNDVVITKEFEDDPEIVSIMDESEPEMANISDISMANYEPPVEQDLEESLEQDVLEKESEESLNEEECVNEVEDNKTIKECSESEPEVLNQSTQSEEPEELNKSKESTYQDDDELNDPTGIEDLEVESEEVEKNNSEQLEHEETGNDQLPTLPPDEDAQCQERANLEQDFCVGEEEMEQPPGVEVMNGDESKNEDEEEPTSPEMSPRSINADYHQHPLIEAFFDNGDDDDDVEVVMVNGTSTPISDKGSESGASSRSTHSRLMEQRPPSGTSITFDQEQDNMNEASGTEDESESEAELEQDVISRPLSSVISCM